MKTRTYMRWSLLIPFLLWGVFLLLIVLLDKLLPGDLASNGSPVLSEIAGVVLVFYVIGILFWLVPYLLLSSILLFSSMKSQMKVLIYLFLLSPFGMAMLMIIEMAILSIFIPQGSVPSSNMVSTIEGTIGLSVVAVIASLVGGYICVGLGFGIYKLFQHLGMIKQDEMNPALELMVVNS